MAKLPTVLVRSTAGPSMQQVEELVQTWLKWDKDLATRSQVMGTYTHTQGPKCGSSILRQIERPPLTRKIHVCFRSLIIVIGVQCAGDQAGRSRRHGKADGPAGASFGIRWDRILFRIQVLVITNNWPL